MTKEYNDYQRLFLELDRQLKKLRITSHTLNMFPQAKMHVEAAIKNLEHSRELVSNKINELVPKKDPDYKV